jgi:hypothetical protein
MAMVFRDTLFLSENCNANSDSKFDVLMTKQMFTDVRTSDPSNAINKVLGRNDISFTCA